jgi:hypothetical protein
MPALTGQQADELAAEGKPDTVRIKLEAGVIEWNDLVSDASPSITTNWTILSFSDRVAFRFTRWQ